MCSLTENKFCRCPHVGEHHKAKKQKLGVSGHQWIDAPVNSDTLYPWERPNL